MTSPFGTPPSGDPSGSLPPPPPSGPTPDGPPPPPPPTRPITEEVPVTPGPASSPPDLDDPADSPPGTGRGSTQVVHQPLRSWSPPDPLEPPAAPTDQGGPTPPWWVIAAIIGGAAVACYVVWILTDTWLSNAQPDGRGYWVPATALGVAGGLWGLLSGGTGAVKRAAFGVAAGGVAGVVGSFLLGGADSHSEAIDDTLLSGTSLLRALGWGAFTAAAWAATLGAGTVRSRMPQVGIGAAAGGFTTGAAMGLLAGTNYFGSSTRVVPTDLWFSTPIRDAGAEVTVLPLVILAIGVPVTLAAINRTTVALAGRPLLIGAMASLLVPILGGVAGYTSDLDSARRDGILAGGPATTDPGIVVPTLPGSPETTGPESTVPASSEPASSEPTVPASSEPTNSEPTLPASSEPTNSGPAATGTAVPAPATTPGSDGPTTESTATTATPATTDTAETAPATFAPTDSDPLVSDPAGSDPVGSSPAGSDPVDTAPVAPTDSEPTDSSPVDSTGASTASSDPATPGDTVAVPFDAGIPFAVAYTGAATNHNGQTAEVLIAVGRAAPVSEADEIWNGPSTCAAEGDAVIPFIIQVATTDPAVTYVDVRFSQGAVDPDAAADHPMVIEFHDPDNTTRCADATAPDTSNTPAFTAWPAQTPAAPGYAYGYFVVGGFFDGDTAVGEPAAVVSVVPIINQVVTSTVANVDGAAPIEFTDPISGEPALALDLVP